MREIKFRAFIKEKKKMILNNHSAMSIKMFTPNYAFLNSEVEVMQYTGLKDKNGVEIYEGDVIRFHGSKLGEVVWRCDYKQLGYYLKVDGELRRVLSPAENYALEVIGNIYENSELLEESK